MVSDLGRGQRSWNLDLSGPLSTITRKENQRQGKCAGEENSLEELRTKKKKRNLLSTWPFIALGFPKIAQKLSFTYFSSRSPNNSTFSATLRILQKKVVQQSCYFNCFHFLLLCFQPLQAMLCALQASGGESPSLVRLLVSSVFFGLDGLDRLV